MKIKSVFVLFLIATLFINGWIFYNSSKGTVESHQESDSVTELVKPVIPEKVSQNKETTGLFVRKSAHVVEFLCLGVAVCVLVITVKVLFKRSLLGLGMFYVTTVAVTDEFIQSFTGRTSSVDDIVIDLMGGFVGLLSVWAIYGIYRLIRNKILKSHRLGGKYYEENQSS